MVLVKDVNGKMNNIILLCGKSGTGKSTIAEELEKKYGLRQVQSYTTRQPRYPNEKGHIFINREFFNALKEDMVAYTFFNNRHYGVTTMQIDKCSTYVVDPSGIEYFKEKYKGNKTPIVIWIDCPLHTRFFRMLKRGDSLFKIISRIINDYKMFSNVAQIADYKIINKDIDTSLEKVYTIYNK